MPDWSLYFPITDPTLIFFVVLLIILFSPIVMGRLRIPHLIGLVLAGIVVGKYGLNILNRDDSFELFGRVGLFYIMFLAGLEMDLEGLKKNRMRVGTLRTAHFLAADGAYLVGIAVDSPSEHTGIDAHRLYDGLKYSHCLPHRGTLWTAAVDGIDAQRGLVDDFALLGARRLGGHRQLCSGHVELGVLAVVHS